MTIQQITAAAFILLSLIGAYASQSAALALCAGLSIVLFGLLEFLEIKKRQVTEKHDQELAKLKIEMSNLKETMQDLLNHKKLRGQ
jgi:uncharacterized protein YsxB (DUF464 family)